MDKPKVSASMFGNKGHLIIGNVSMTTSEAEFKALCQAVLKELRLGDYQDNLVEWVAQVTEYLNTLQDKE